MKDLKSIFEKGKAGDVIGFVIDGNIKQMPIQIATQGEYTHVAIIIQVVSKREDEFIFYISEQTISGGCKYRRVEITRSKLDGEYIYETDDEYFNKQCKITLASLERELTKEENVKLQTYAKKNIGKKYGFFTLFLGFAFLEKIMPRFLEKKLSKYIENNDKVCSTHIKSCYKSIGSFKFSSDDYFSDPTETMNLPFLKKC